MFSNLTELFLYHDCKIALQGIALLDHFRLLLLPKVAAAFNTEKPKKGQHRVPKPRVPWISDFAEGEARALQTTNESVRALSLQWKLRDATS